MIYWCSPPATSRLDKKIKKSMGAIGNNALYYLENQSLISGRDEKRDPVKNEGQDGDEPQ